MNTLPHTALRFKHPIASTVNPRCRKSHREQEFVILNIRYIRGQLNCWTKLKSTTLGTALHDKYVSHFCVHNLPPQIAAAEKPNIPKYSSHNRPCNAAIQSRDEVLDTHASFCSILSHAAS